MEVESTPIAGALKLSPAVHGDARGFFQETFHAARYREAGIDVDFVQDNHSRSVKGVLRGLHFQLAKPQAKLVWVARGEVLDVAVDIRRGSPTFGRSFAAKLTDVGGEQLYLPAGLAHGFLVLSETCDFCYKCSDVYSGADDQKGILWSDPALGIDWQLQAHGIDAPLLSDKDAAAPRLGALGDDALPTYD
jgi:dTDP-4-dehydrorhamnose 3,5-epimerase